MKLSGYIKKIIPLKLKLAVNRYLFTKKYGFLPPPLFTDMGGYEYLLDAIIQQKICQLEGDFVEIGAFLGGGTYKLSKLIDKFALDKKVYAVDVFDPDFDKTERGDGKTMSELYNFQLKGKNQYEIYKKTTKDCKNVITLSGDSKKIAVPCQKISFAYIDGNHSAEYVRNDFYLVWDKLVSRGIVAFDDYGCDLLGVTEMADWLISQHSDKILRTWRTPPKTLFIQKK